MRQEDAAGFAAAGVAEEDPDEVLAVVDVLLDPPLLDDEPDDDVELDDEAVEVFVPRESVR
ncbi:hypothetical protein ACTHAM_002009 [Cellulomonas soli]|uniref:hypothetical protein n=1 Tax=Cellulomonas soli TaxID=931535 RepID=UPI003F85588F